MGYYYNCLILCLLYIFEIISAGPVSIRIEADTNSNFHLGPNPKATFELLENYNPLGVAVNAKHANFSSSKPLPQVVKPSKIEPQTQPANEVSTFEGESSENNNVLEPPAPTTTPYEPEPIVVEAMGRNFYQNVKLQKPRYKIRVPPKKSRWFDWTKWSDCSEGKRIRTRTCYIVGGAQCEGPSIEIQRCFSTFDKNIAVAKDPHVIEKEILGIDITR